MENFVGVILAGGFGFRMLPATKVINKALLPVYSSEGAVPMLYYPLHSLISCGIKRILIISSQEYCGRIIELFGDGGKFNVDLTYKIQDMNNPQKPPGIAGALKIAKDFTNNNKFAVILGDNFFEDKFGDYVENFLNSNYLCHIFLRKVKNPNRFGCAYLKNKEIKCIVEKPKIPKSNLIVTGLYFYSPQVYEVAGRLQVSRRGELEISDINNFYIEKNQIKYDVLKKYWSDMGTPESMVATQEFINKNNYKLGINKS